MHVEIETREVIGNNGVVVAGDIRVVFNRGTHQILEIIGSAPHRLEMIAEWVAAEAACLNADTDAGVVTVLRHVLEVLEVNAEVAMREGSPFMDIPIEQLGHPSRWQGINNA